MALTSALLDQAALAVAVHGLRSHDGVQLAGALAARESAGIDRFACFDLELRTAAATPRCTCSPPHAGHERQAGSSS